MRRTLNVLAEEELEHKAKLEAVKAEKITPGENEVGTLGIAATLKEIKPYSKVNYRDLPALTIEKEDLFCRLYTELASKMPKNS